MSFSDIEWDRGNWPKCGNHGVPRRDIDSLLLDPALTYFPDREHSQIGDRWIDIGINSSSGRWLLVIFTLIPKLGNRDSGGVRKSARA